MLSDLSKGQVKNGDFDNSRMAKMKSLDLSKRQPNYIEISKIDRVIFILGEKGESTSFKVGYKLKRWFTVLGLK